MHNPWKVTVFGLERWMWLIFNRIRIFLLQKSTHKPLLGLLFLCPSSCLISRPLFGVRDRGWENTCWLGSQGLMFPPDIGAINLYFGLTPAEKVTDVLSSIGAWLQSVISGLLSLHHFFSTNPALLLIPPCSVTSSIKGSLQRRGVHCLVGSALNRVLTKRLTCAESSLCMYSQRAYGGIHWGH